MSRLRSRLCPYYLDPRSATGIAVASAIFALLFFTAPSALAHGGVIAPPPPSSGPGGAPGRPTGDPPSHVDPGIGGPPITTPGGKPELTPDRPFKRKRHDETPTFEHSWELWWEINRTALLPAPQHVRPKVVTPAGAEGPTPWESERARLAKDRVLPYLRTLVSPENKKVKADVRGSALLALGKLSDAAADIARIQHWLEAESAKPSIRESAALAIGLLRRSQPSLQRAATELDPLRSRLLMIWDRRIGPKRLRVPERTRVFVMYALGLLGDQPFDVRTQAKDGALFSGILWERVGMPYDERELRIAPLVALGLQPPAGLTAQMRTGLEAILADEKVRGRKWDPYERSHTLTAVARLGGPSSRGRILRLVSSTKQHDAVRLAAILAMGASADSWTSIERSLAFRALQRLTKSKSEGVLLRGLARISMARFLDADLRSGGVRLLATKGLVPEMESAIRSGRWWDRGYALIALGIAARHAKDAGPRGATLYQRAGVLLVDALRTKTLHASARGAAAVALGLLGDTTQAGALTPIVRGAKNDAEVRGHAAVALGQLGAKDVEARAALESAIAQRRVERLRGRAALALSLIGSTAVAGKLTDELRTGRSVAHLSQVAVALGTLGNLTAVPALLETSRTAKNELVRAMALVALGRLLDPEPRPSLLRILVPANYPARSGPLHEALTIL